MAYKSNEERPFESGKCPTPEEVIAHYLANSKRRVPTGMPTDGFQAARWWMAHQAPADNFTEAATPPGTKGGTWVTPYHDRLMYTLRRFLKLKAVQQVYVIEHINKGIPWKGDEITFYTTIVDETAKMHEDKEKYIDGGFVKMHEALRSMTV